MQKQLLIGVGIFIVVLIASSASANMLTTNYNGINVDFASAYYLYDSWGIHSTISTNKLISSQGSSPDVSYWIAIYAQGEFIQIGYWTSGGDQIYAFWATRGPVANTNYVSQNIGKISAGTPYDYAIKFNGNSWELYFNGAIIKTISYPYPAYQLEVSGEYQSTSPNPAGVVNGGIATFSRMTVLGTNNFTYPFWEVPVYPTYEIDRGSNGISWLSHNSLQIGWGLPTTVVTNPWGDSEKFRDRGGNTPSIYSLPILSALGMILTLIGAGGAWFFGKKWAIIGYFVSILVLVMIAYAGLYPFSLTPLPHNVF